MTDAPHSAGLLASFQRLLGSSLGLLHNRIELLGIELAEERENLLSLIVLSMLAAICLGAGMVFLAVLIAYLCWDTHPALVLSLFAVLFLSVGGFAWWRAVRQPRLGTHIFSASLAELHKDGAALTADDLPPPQP
jgi:uncharacterized membrane protein YqjE